jgi:predicted phosphodiesterase
MKEIFISDIHWPFHNKAAYNVLLKVAQYRQPDILHVGGDGVDFHSISRHPKHIADRNLLKYEVDEAKKEIARLRVAAPNAQLNFQEGNHDKRMQLYLRDRAPELADLFELTFPKLMGLPELGMKWIPDNERFKIGKLYHHHGHLLPGGGVSPAKAKFAKTYQNIIFGHHHRFDYFATRQYGTGELFQSIGNAMLYTLDPEYSHVNDWQIGFTEVNYVKSGDFSVNQVHINKRTDGSYFSIVDGYEFNSTDDENIDKYLRVAAKKIASRKGRSTQSK